MNKEDKEKIEKEIAMIESEMMKSDFWNNKDKAQEQIAKMQELKDQLEGFGKHDRGGAIVNIFSGAGGLDAEDWSSMLFSMYKNWALKNNFQISILDQNENSHGGFRSITFEITGKNAYGIFKKESGVHRLVRISPFNANDKRQTSFSMVEVLPEIKDDKEILLEPDDLEIDFTKSSGPGGQNVNKRETAVRIKHKPTDISVYVSTERSQAQNKEKAMQLLKSKIFTLQEKQRERGEDEIKLSKNTANEWGSQIRSYILHPYKLVKDHRNGFETTNVDKVLAGDIDEILNSLKNI